MRLIGYPAEKISILTTYNGQRDLIKYVFICFLLIYLFVIVMFSNDDARGTRCSDARRQSRPWTSSKASRTTIFSSRSCALAVSVTCATSAVLLWLSRVRGMHIF